MRPQAPKCGLSTKAAPTTGAEAATTITPSERDLLLDRATAGNDQLLGLAVQELHAPPHRVRRAPRPVLRLPLAEDQPAADRDLPPLAQVSGAGLGVLAEGGDVDVGRLAGVASAPRVVDRDTQRADGAVLRRAKLRVAGQVADQADVVHLLPPFPPAPPGGGIDLDAASTEALGPHNRVESESIRATADARSKNASAANDDRPEHPRTRETGCELLGAAKRKPEDDAARRHDFFGGAQHPVVEGACGQAAQGRRERGVLCTRAIEDAEMRSATCALKSAAARGVPCEPQATRAAPPAASTWSTSTALALPAQELQASPLADRDRPPLSAATAGYPIGPPTWTTPTTPTKEQA